MAEQSAFFSTSAFEWLPAETPQSSRPNKQAVAEKLVESSPTAGYRAPTPLQFFYGFGNSIPPLYRYFFDWPMMELHPNVKMAMGTYKAGINGVNIVVKASNPSVKRFVEEQYKRLWATSLGVVQEGYDYGWGGFEVLYRFDDGNCLSIDYLKSFHPRDVRLLLRDNIYYGIRVSNVVGQSKAVDLWGPSRGLSKAFWYAHNARYGQFHGWPQGLGAWRPWRRLAYQDGAEDTIDMAVYRFGVQGPTVWFPPGKKAVADEKRDPRDPGNRDLARNMSEQAKAGMSTAFPSLFDEKHGHKLWDIDWPEHVINVDSLVKYNGSLEDMISLGIGVPPEMNSSPEGGSMGYRGREIPLEAYYEGQTGVARSIVRQFGDQVLLPLVKWNFGPEEKFDADVEPLGETRKRKGMDQGPGGPANGQGGQQGPPKRPPSQDGNSGGPSKQLSTIRDDDTGRFIEPPTLGDPDMDAILAAILLAIRPINREFVNDLVWVLQTMPESERWDKARELLAQHRETIILALTEAGLGSALVAMRRVVEQLPTSIPSEAIVPPVVPPLDIRSSGFDDKQPAYRLTMIDEAVANLQARELFTKADFDDLNWQVKQLAFTVAGVPDVETIRNIRESIADAAAEGWSQQTWMKRVHESLGRDPFLSPRHQETVFRTNIQDAYSKGLDKVLDHKYVGTYFPYEAIEPILDNRVRPHHAALKTSGINGTNVYRRDDPTYAIVKPPSAYNCRCGRRPLTVDVAARAGVKEAQEWKESGTEPIEKAWVPLPAGWVDDGFRRLATLPPSSAPAQQSGGWFEKWRNDLATIFAAANVPVPHIIQRLQTGAADAAGHYHAPPGGVSIRGKEFAGGEFIYAEDFAAATPEQQQQIKAHTESVQGTGKGVMSVADELRRVYGPPKGKHYTNEAIDYFDAVGREIHKRYGSEWTSRVAELKHKLEGVLGSEKAAADPNFRNVVMGKLSGLNWIMQHPPKEAGRKDEINSGNSVQPQQPATTRSPDAATPKPELPQKPQAPAAKPVFKKNPLEAVGEIGERIKAKSGKVPDLTAIYKIHQAYGDNPTDQQISQALSDMPAAKPFSPPPYAAPIQAHESATPNPPKIQEVDAGNIARPANVEHGKAYNVPTSELNVDPERFQYKAQGIGSDGVTKELKGINKWDPNYAGIVSVWRDPADGKDYVVNGHHRFELAKRLGVDGLRVQYLDEPDADSARTRGALINIAEGRGTAVDAAKVLRDKKADASYFKANGVSVDGPIARDAGTLAKLSGGLFNSVAREQIPLSRALTIGRELPDHDKQDQLARWIDNKERGGRDFSDKVVAEMAREMATSTTVQKTDADSLFGDAHDEAVFAERAELKAHLRDHLTRTKRDFQAVGSTRRAEQVSQAGNVLNVEENQQRAKDADKLMQAFDTFAQYKGPFSDLLNQHAGNLAKVNNDTERKRIRDQFSRDAGDLLPRLVESGGRTGPAVAESSGGGETGAGAVRAGENATGNGQDGAGVDVIPGGKAAGKPDSVFPAAAIAQGQKVESEHTTSPAVAKEIAKDHLVEDPKYYDKLAKMESGQGSQEAKTPPARTDLWGNPLPKEFHSGPKMDQADMFPGTPGLAASGSAWMDAAKDLAAERGVKIEQIHVNQRVKIGGKWHSVKRNADGWTLEAEQNESALSNAAQRAQQEASGSAPMPEKGNTIWTQSRKTGRQHKWTVIGPGSKGNVLARNDSGIQRELKPGEWRTNPADLPSDDPGR